RGSVEDRDEPRVILEGQRLRPAATAAAPPAPRLPCRPGRWLLRDAHGGKPHRQERDDRRGASYLHDWTFSHCLDLADASTASVTRSVASPSRNAGDGLCPFAAAQTNSMNWCVNVCS